MGGEPNRPVPGTSFSPGATQRRELKAPESGRNPVFSFVFESLAWQFIATRAELRKTPENLVDSGSSDHVRFTALGGTYMKEEVKQIVDEVIVLLESRELPDFCNNENKCKKCGLRQTCYNEEEINNLLKIRIA